MSRVFNFSAGPAALPLEVLEQIRNDLPDWQRTGMSVMEVSHRSKEFVALAERADTYDIGLRSGLPNQARDRHLKGQNADESSYCPRHV
jgi:phosphoserine aminotransferase